MVKPREWPARPSQRLGPVKNRFMIVATLFGILGLTSGMVMYLLVASAPTAISESIRVPPGDRETCQ